MTIDQYISTISKRYALGNSTEHTFRGDLQQLMESLVPNIRATNEPKRQACGAPDYIINLKEIPVGYIEAKDIGDTDLAGEKKNGNKEQFDRYKASLQNIIFTDYLNFHIYRDGQFFTKVSIAKLENGKIKPIPEAFDNFISVIKDFCSYIGQTITSSKRLAELMAGKAQLLNEVILKALKTEYEDNTTLLEQYEAFKKVLIHDLTLEDFSDFYAQSIAYGMFAARFHDMTLKTFSRQDAAYLIPKSNPFLSKLFTYIAGPDIDDRILWIVDSLADIFRAVDTEETLKDFQSHNGTEDPFIHFYEHFLEMYDSDLRKQRGVYYTPLPIVDFIVRSIDLLLQDKELFNIKQGLADASTIEVKTEEGIQKIHQVQILDFATGTGTFLNETIKHIYKKFENQKGMWSLYVEENLIPRLHGFEILMAPYTMCHTKIELLLDHTHYKPKNKLQRIKVYLTNTLENSYIDTTTFFDKWLTHESSEAQKVKRENPIMVILGNPPYSNFGDVNNGEWILNELKVYKEGLDEKKLNLDDDYIKFIRYAEQHVEKTGYGIVGIVTNNSFIDGITHRVMRKHLLETFDRIYVLDLHGSSKKKETSKDGSKDENVFNIQQGTCIVLFVKTKDSKKDQLAEVYFSESFGTRERKYKLLQKETVGSVKWKKLKPVKPYYFFVKKDFKGEREYKKGFGIQELFKEYGSGVKTERDNITIHFDKKSIQKVVKDFYDLSVDEIRYKYQLKKDSRDWKIENAKNDIKNNIKKNLYTKILYRPFDFRYTFYTGTSKGFIGTPGEKRMSHFINQDNIGLIVPRMCKGHKGFAHGLVSNCIIDVAAGDAFSGSGTYFFPLYLYEEETTEGGGRRKSKDRYEKSKHDQNLSFVLKAHSNAGLRYASSVDATQPPTDTSIPKRVPNLNREIVDKIAKGLGIEFVSEESGVRGQGLGNREQVDSAPPASLRETIQNSTFKTQNYFTPIDLLDYIYAVLHSPAYREKYKEFLKIDFPRVPYPGELGNRDQGSGVSEQGHSATSASPRENIQNSTLKIQNSREVFFKLVALGKQLREIHLLESPVVENYITEYPISGDNRVEKINFELSGLRYARTLSNSDQVCVSKCRATQPPTDELNSKLKIQNSKLGKVYINDTQYFDGVPQVAWDFFIGGYQPAQKWLKDRKGRVLDFDDILHYQKIIVALTETDRLMKEVDRILNVEF
jgi:hypothetical protein